MADKEYTHQNKAKPVTGVMRRSLIFVFLMILVFCLVLIGRLVYLNNVDGDKYAKAVLSQQSYSSTVIPSERGMITDRNGVVLAKSVRKYNVILDPAVILSQPYFYEPTMKALTEIMGYDRDEIDKVINDNSKSSYVVYEKDIDYERVSEYRAYADKTKFVVGVWFEEEFGRVYPYSTLASHVIGFTTKDGVGTYGIEEYYNDELTGIDGLSYGYFDAELNMTGTVKDAINGRDIVSTIDFSIQSVVESKVAEFNETTGANNIGVIVMNPNNGEILAMASNREYDLNSPRSLKGVLDDATLAEMDSSQQLNALYKVWRNFCVSDSFEPGSTFKTITVASALEEDVVETEDRFTCIGYREVGGWKISCNNKYGHGNITLAQALMKSCNCALMEIATRMGRDSFAKNQELFGFGKKTGIDLTGESTGILIPKKNLNATELCTSSFGTTFNATMIQIAAAYGSIINGGTYYRPHVVKEIRNSDGTQAVSFDNTAVRQTVSRETSEFIRQALYMTVESGTGTLAKVKGYLIGGKTGTAQKRPREDKKYVVSFAGFAPVDDPKVLVYVVVDEVHDPALSASSSPATRMTSAIMQEILPYIGEYPSGSIQYTVDLSLIPDIENIDYIAEEDEKTLDVLPEGLDAGD